MVNPVGNTDFAQDYHRVVTQDLFKELPPQGVEPEKKFDLKGADKSEKGKKGSDKQKEKKQRPFNMD